MMPYGRPAKFEKKSPGRGTDHLVTGNRTHNPMRDFIVTPAEMVQIPEKEYEIELGA